MTWCLARRHPGGLQGATKMPHLVQKCGMRVAEGNGDISRAISVPTTMPTCADPSGCRRTARRSLCDFAGLYGCRLQYRDSRLITAERPSPALLEQGPD